MWAMRPRDTGTAWKYRAECSKDNSRMGQSQKSESHGDVKTNDTQQRGGSHAFELCGLFAAHAFG